MTIYERLEGSGIVSESPLMREVVGQIHKAAASTTGVMVCGEPGTGRGLVARTIHAFAHAGVVPAQERHPDASRGPAPVVPGEAGTQPMRQNSAPFVTIDGSALLPAEAECRVFGVPGNGRGNGERRTPHAPEAVYPGSLLHDALNGTVFFRHLEELPARTQARLATLLRDREFLDRPDGEALPFSARPIAAADPDHQSHVDEGRVRPDLHRRLAEFRIALSPLRNRREDIPALAQFFITQACRERDIAERTLDSAAQAVLAAMPWHGNLRELSDLLDSLVRAAADDGPITLRVLLDHVSLEGRNAPHPSLGAPLREARQRFEREYIAAVVAQHHGRIPDAAKTLGIQRTNLYRKLRELRLPRPAETSVAPAKAGAQAHHS